MSTTFTPTRGSIRVFEVLPPVILNLGAILGLGMGFYFNREHNLLPWIFSHVIADLWTFGLSKF